MGFPNGALAAHFEAGQNPAPLDVGLARALDQGTRGLIRPCLGNTVICRGLLDYAFVRSVPTHTIIARRDLGGVPYPHVVADAFTHVMPAVWLSVPFTGAQGMGGQTTGGDPNSTDELTTPGNGLTFRTPDVYLIEALADGLAFARRELRVVAKAQAEPYPAALAPSAL